MGLASHNIRLNIARPAETDRTIMVHRYNVSLHVCARWIRYLLPVFLISSEKTIRPIILIQVIITSTMLKYRDQVLFELIIQRHKELVECYQTRPLYLAIARVIAR